MRKPKIAIIGAGISGLFAAKMLSEKAGDRVAEIIIFEKRSGPGGLITATPKDKLVWDNGVFIFFQDSPLVKLFPDEFSVIEDHAQLAWNGKNFAEFPLSINAIFSSLPKTKLVKILVDYTLSRLRIALRLVKPNFHDWLRNRITSTILEYSMLENYIVKLQGKKTIELSDKLGRERFSEIDISTKPLNLFKRLYGSVKKKNPSRVSSPMYSFTLGASAFSNRLAQLCLSKGIKIRYDCIVNKIIKNSNNTIVASMSSNGQQFDYQADIIIATNPITEIRDTCDSFFPGNTADYTKRLSYKKLLLLFYAVNKPCIMNKHLLLYSLDPKQPWKRLKAHSQLGNTTNLIVEAMYDHEQKNEIARSVTDALIDDLKLFDRGDIIAIEHGFINEAYPVYTLGHEIMALSIIDSLQEHNVYLCGRQGAFRYFSSDKAIQSASEIVDNIINKID